MGGMRARGKAGGKGNGNARKKVTSGSKAKTAVRRTGTGGGKSKRRGTRQDDVYSDEEDERDGEKMEARADIDGTYEYEAPEDFGDHDSEIDEDEAFNSEDDAQYGAFFNGKTGKRSQEEADADEEMQDDEEEDAEDGGQLLSDMLGTAPASALPVADGQEDEALLSEDNDNEDEEDDGKHAKLLSMIDTLVAPGKKARKVVEEIAEDAAPSNGAADGELTLASLLGGDATAPDQQQEAAVRKVKKQMRALEADAASNGGALSAAPAVVQEARETRKLAYAQKKEDVDVFQPVVRRNRQKTTMDFREQLPKMERLTAAALVNKFNAETSMEKQVEALLQQGAANGKAVVEQENEELEQNDVSPEEVAKRQKELAKMRALLFYEEQKAKRVKKIKSKLYHKIRNNQDRKEREKAQQQLRELDPELAKQLDTEMAEKRAAERMSLKHTNTSKWVKHQLKRGINADQGTRTMIAEQLRRGEELRRKMQTTASDDDEEDEDLSGSEDDDVDAVTRLQQRLEKQAQALVTEIDDDGLKQGKQKGVAGMKFMQRAVTKQREKARVEAEKLLREIKGDDGILSEGDAASSDEDTSRNSKVKTRKRKADAVITKESEAAVAAALPSGSLQTAQVSMDKGLSARSSGSVAVNLNDETSGPSVGIVDSDVKATTTELGVKEPISQQADALMQEPAPEQTTENPWLSSSGQSKKKKKKKKTKKNSKASIAQVVDVGDAVQALTSQATTSLQHANSSSKKRKLDDTQTSKDPTTNGKTKHAKTSERASKKTTNDHQLQEDLVRRAFAFAEEDDNEIAREKEALADQDVNAKKGAEIAKLVGLSGWGSWAGEGVKTSRQQQKRQLEAERLAIETKKKVLASRRDSKMDRVLLNEKKDKRAAKFTTQDVPYPFTSREEYEMAMRNPLGRDWNTTAAADALTAPKIIKRAGQMLDPLRLTKDEKKRAIKEMSKKRKAKF